MVDSDRKKLEKSQEYILKRLAPLTPLLQNVAMGDFSRNAKIPEKEDEFTELFVGLNLMIEDLRDLEKTQKEAEKRRMEIAAATEDIRRLREIDKTKDEFLNIVAHELKGPLMPVSAQVQLFMAGAFGKISTEQKESLGMMLRNVNAFDKLVSDLLDITKIKSRKLTLVRESVSVEEIIQEAVSDLKSRAQEQQITLSVNADFMPKISADPKRIKQVLVNLLDNALKFTQKKGKITIEAENKKDAIVFIKIKDTGIGILQPQGNLKKLFTPFFQIDTFVTREKGGTGLGLAICKGIVEAHGGKIWAESSGKNKGSTFSLTLPLKPPRNIGQPLPYSHDRAQQGAEAFFESIHEAALLIDDEWKIISVNKGFEELTGFSKEELRGTYTNQYDPMPQYHLRPRDYLKKAFLYKLPPVFETTRFTKHDGYIHVEARYVELSSKDGLPRVIYLVRKIPRGNIRFIKEISKQYANTPQGVILSDAVGRIIWANQKAKTLLGRSDRQLLNWRIQYLLEPCSSTNILRYQYIYQRIKQRLYTTGKVLEQKLPFYQNEKKRFVLITTDFFLLLDENGYRKGFLAILRNPSEA